MLPLTDPILVFTILVLCMLVAPLFSQRLHIPDMVFLLGFGALLGPNGFHVLDRNTAVTMLGSVGLLYIMFLAGIEINLYRFMRSYKRSVFFGLTTFLIPQTLGALAGHFVLGMNWSASLLLASMFASHTLLAYPLASRLGISRREPVTITVGATIITDILALMVLAVIADSAKGIPMNPVFWATISFGMLALTVLIWKGVPYASRWFFQRITEESNAQFLFVLAVLCICAYISHFARLEPIIGAFLAGAAFNRMIPEHSTLMNRVMFAGHTLFIPFFLISVGMLVDPLAMLTGTRGWLVSATMVVMVIVTKYGASQISRLLFGYSRSAGNVMFGLSVVQAAATLAAVMVGYDLKIFDESVLNGTIVMILVTCSLGSWIVDRHGRRMAAEEPVQPESSGVEQRLLVSVTNPESASRLLDLSFLLRNTARPGDISPMTIVREQNNIDDAVVKAEKLLGKCLVQAASADIPVNPGLRVAINVSDGIVRAARELRSSMVIVGWTAEKSTSIRIFGTVMQHLVVHCASRLLFCRLVNPLNTTKRLLAPFPPLASRRRDISALIDDIKMLAHQAGAELRVYTCVNENETLKPMLEAAKPSCSMNIVNESSWDSIQQILFSEIMPDDMLLIPSDRRNGILWTPALDHLPEIIVERFPEINMLVDYPSLPDMYQEYGDETADKEDEHFPAMLPVDLCRECSLDLALSRLVDTVFPGKPDTARDALNHLMDSARSYPIELQPGIILLHARYGDIEKPQLMVCHAPDGWPLPNLPSPARIILVLLGSQTRPPEHHLKTLSRVASRVLSAGQKPEMQKAGTASEICELLKDDGV